MPSNKWDKYAAPEAATGASKWDKYAQPDQGPQPITSGNKSALAPAPAVPGLNAPSTGDQFGAAAKSFGGEMLHNLNPVNAIQGIGQTLAHPIDTLTSGMSEQRAKVPGDLSKGNYNDAFIHGVGGTIPILGPMYARGLDAATANDPVEGGKALADVASLKAVPKIYGAVSKGLGKATQAPAEPIAEHALGVRNVDRRFSRNPGKAIINETEGFRPSTVAASADAQIGDLSKQVDHAAARATSSGTMSNLDPAVKHLGGVADQAASLNSTLTPRGIAPMQSYLTEAGPGFRGKTTPAPPTITQQPGTVLGPNGKPVMNTVITPSTKPPMIDRLQTPTDLLGMKRQFGKDYVDFKKHEVPDPVNEAAKGAYHALDSELDRTVPAAENLNGRISNLMPVARRAGDKALNAGPIPQILGRFTTPTGALVGAATGAAQGYSHFGVPGAIAGGLGGLGVPALIASPTAQMIAARTLNATGKAMQSPAGINAAKVAGSGSLLKKKQRSEK